MTPGPVVSIGVPNELVETLDRLHRAVQSATVPVGGWAVSCRLQRTELLRLLQLIGAGGLSGQARAARYEHDRGRLTDTVKRMVAGLG